MSTDLRTLGTAALRELAIVSPEETPSADDLAWVLNVANRLVSQWNTRKRFIVVMSIQSFTFTTSQQSYSIGRSAANFNADRPSKIEWANLIQTSVNPNERWPLEVIEVADYGEITIPTETAEIPAELYYAPTVPNGTLWPWPYPEDTAAAKNNKLELAMWTRLASFTALDTAIDLADGYDDAIVLSLAERLAPSFGLSVSPELEAAARRARSAIQSVNSKAPKLATRDSGMPGTGRPMRVGPSRSLI